MLLLLFISLFLIGLGFFCFWLTFKEIINHTYIETANKVAIWITLSGVASLIAYFTQLLFTLIP